MSAEHKAAKKIAKKTIEKFSVSCITSSSIKNIIYSFGYTVIRYSEKDKESEPMRLIRTLNLLDIARIKDSFTYRENPHKIVFVRSEISDDDYLYFLSLELGYIVSGKENQCDINADIFAHEFAHHICDMSCGSLLYNTFKYYPVQGVLAFACILVCICTLSYTFIYEPLTQAGNENYSVFEDELVKPEILESVVDAFAHTETDISGNTELTTDVQSFVLDENDRVFYATKSGTKYHAYGCSYISGKETKQLTSDDLSTGKYTPCSRCIK